jgi:hypothetical protein
MKGTHWLSKCGVCGLSKTDNLKFVSIGMVKTLSDDKMQHLDEFYVFLPVFS